MKTNYETNGTATYTFTDEIHGGTYTLCTFGAKTAPTLSRHENIWDGRTVDRMTAAGILRAARSKLRKALKELDDFEAKSKLANLVVGPQTTKQT